MEIVCEQAPLLQFRAKSNLARGEREEDGAHPYPFPQVTLGLSACANSPRSIY